MTTEKDTEKRSVYLTLSLADAVDKAAAYLEMSQTDTMAELIRRGLVVGSPLRPRGQRSILGLDVSENTKVATLYEDAALGEGIKLFRERFGFRSYSSTIRVLLCSGLYGYSPELEEGDDKRE